MGLSQKDQTKHNTLLRLGMQSVKTVKRFQPELLKCGFTRGAVEGFLPHDQKTVPNTFRQ